MKAVIKSFNQLTVSRLFLCIVIGWGVSSCSVSIKGDPTVRLIVLDSVGRPIPNFSVDLIGWKQNFTTPGPVRTYNSLTNSSGTITQTISWKDGVSFYIIGVGPDYFIYDCPLPGNSPGLVGCNIMDINDITATVRVKKR